MKNLIMITFVIGMGILLYSLFTNVKHLKEKNRRLETNLTEIQKDNSELKFERGELKDYLNKKDTEHKLEVDSILRANSIKVRQLI